MTVSLPAHIIEHKTNEAFEERLSKLYGWGNVIDDSEDQQNIMASHLVRICYQSMPFISEIDDKDCTYRAVRNMLLRALVNMDNSREEHDTSYILDLVNYMMIDTVKEPEPEHNPNELYIEAKCGVNETIELSQEINLIKFMGKEYDVDYETGEITEKLQGLGALFG